MMMMSMEHLVKLELAWETEVPIYLSIYLSIYISIYGSTAFCWTLAAVSVSLSSSKSAGLLGRGSAGRKAANCTQDSTNTE
jgi:hypothetical protein